MHRRREGRKMYRKIVLLGQAHNLTNVKSRRSKSKKQQIKVSQAGENE